MVVVFQKLISMVCLAAQKLTGGRPLRADTSDSEPIAELACCSQVVHIAFRGVSDDRLYLSYNRQWAEVKYFKPYGLRVFCAVCRRRLF